MNRLLTDGEMFMKTFTIRDNPDAELREIVDFDIDKTLEAQDKKSISLRDKQWIDKIEKFGMTAVPSDYMYIISETEWQSLKKEMESE